MSGNYFCHVCGGLVDLIKLQPSDVRLCECEKRFARLRAENNRLKAELAEAKKCKSNEDLQDVVSKALRNAWHLGQTYWQQADSEYYSQNKRAEETFSKFDALVDKTLQAMKGK